MSDNEIKTIRLKQIIHEINEPIYQWNFTKIDEEIRIFYKLVEYEKGDTDKGFHFCITRLVSSDGKADPYSKEDSEFDILMSGTAYFDGLRHLYFGDEKTSNYGYYYYPNINKIIKILEALRNLELKHCWDADK